MPQTVRQALSTLARENLQHLVGNPIVAKAQDMNGTHAQLRSYAARETLSKAGLIVEERSLGGHPAFSSLQSDETRTAPVTTMFADLRNFTKYALFLPLHQVREIKATVIRTAVDTVHAFGGHVHNIPGDGVMAFFGMPGDDPRLGALQALRAGAHLLTVIRDDVSVFLMEEGIFDEPVKMRVGIEHGEALWGHYGAQDTSEVKATGFAVDFAAKVQQKVHADELGFGEGLAELLSVPDDFIIRQGEDYRRQYKKVERVVKSYIFDWVAFIDSEDEANLQNMESTYPDWGSQGEYINPRAKELPAIKAHGIKLEAFTAAQDTGPWRQKYNSMRKLPKRWHLRFKVMHDVSPPFHIEWEVVNHGAEAYGANGTGHIRSHGKSTNEEGTRFRGTHLMVCTISKDGVPVARALRKIVIS